MNSRPLSIPVILGTTRLNELIWMAKTLRHGRDNVALGS
jgi:hypothetical protein